jgi:hypothetical protein
VNEFQIKVEDISHLIRFDSETEGFHSLPKLDMRPALVTVEYLSFGIQILRTILELTLHGFINESNAKGSVEVSIQSSPMVVLVYWNRVFGCGTT